MPSDQLKSEVTVTFRRELPGNLAARMAIHFNCASDNVQVCAAGTALAGLPNTLAQVAFAKDRDTTAFLYLGEDVRALKIHAERLTASHFETLDNELKAMKELSDNEIKSIERFAKANKNEVSDVKVIISCGDAPLSSARQKRFKARLQEGMKANLAAKAAVPIATALASLTYMPDPASAARALLTGVFAVFVATLVEAGTADSFKYERS